MPSRTYKFRGHRTHGRGYKSGRGAGIRGGKGNAGLHKHKFMAVNKYRPFHFGRHGFKRPLETEEETKTINLQDIEENFENWVAEGKIKEENGVFIADLRAMGIDKLLGEGRITRKLRVIVDACSKQAAEKLQAAGGEVQQ
ncbi:MAG: 50S ribosomal protein L15 [Thermoplasmata archaeon]|nr:50S ribosomal protein L15 [Thermoplasmata archaeon]